MWVSCKPNDAVDVCYKLRGDCIMSYYIGTTIPRSFQVLIQRYFYGLRRNEDGELFLVVPDLPRGGEQNVVIQSKRFRCWFL